MTFDLCCNVMNMLSLLWKLSTLNMIPRDLDAMQAANAFSSILGLCMWFAGTLEG